LIKIEKEKEKRSELSAGCQTACCQGKCCGRFLVVLIIEAGLFWAPG
jgi:hypothetical protein